MCGHKLFCRERSNNPCLNLNMRAIVLIHALLLLMIAKGTLFWSFFKEEEKGDGPAFEFDGEFIAFLKSYGKRYSPDELIERFNQFQKFKKSKSEFESRNPKSNYRVGVTPFSDLSWEEFKEKKLSKKKMNADSDSIYGSDPEIKKKMKERAQAVAEGAVPKPNYEEWTFVTESGAKHPNQRWKKGFQEEEEADEEELSEEERTLFDYSSFDPFGLLGSWFEKSDSKRGKSGRNTYSDNQRDNSEYRRSTAGFDLSFLQRAKPRNQPNQRNSWSSSRSRQSNAWSNAQPSDALQQKFRFKTSEDWAKFTNLERFVDWSAYASPVKDQQTCAACYSFSAISTYEVLYSLNNRRKYEFSIQEVIDCSKENEGCKGGFPHKVYDYINKNGISTMQGYPFFETKGICVKSNEQFRVRAPFKYYFLESNIWDILKALQYGPVNIVHSVNQNFKDYVGGVFDDQTCTGDLIHSAAAVGYDLNASVPYLLLKNAWGEEWGERGYYRIAIGDLNEDNRGICDLCSHKMNTSVYFE